MRADDAPGRLIDAHARPGTASGIYSRVYGSPSLTNAFVRWESNLDPRLREKVLRACDSALILPQRTECGTSDAPRHSKWTRACPPSQPSHTD